MRPARLARASHAHVGVLARGAAVRARADAATDHEAVWRIILRVVTAAAAVAAARYALGDGCEQVGCQKGVRENGETVS